MKYVIRSGTVAHRTGFSIAVYTSTAAEDKFYQNSVDRILHPFENTVEMLCRSLGTFVIEALSDREATKGHYRPRGHKGHCRSQECCKELARQNVYTVL